jgi:hypothetical protein
MDIRFSIADEEDVLSALRRLTQSASPAKMRPVMKKIGEDLAASTKRRFDTSTGSGGNRWPALEQSTVLARLSKVGGAYSKITQKPFKYHARAQKRFQKYGRCRLDPLVPAGGEGGRRPGEGAPLSGATRR